MNEEHKYERVDGISRHYETLWIERGDDGMIKQVYDIEYNPVDKTELSRSFICAGADGGFTYKGEFIPMDNSVDAGKERAYELQRRKRQAPNKDWNTGYANKKESF